jgi:hypothetical protein
VGADADFFDICRALEVPILVAHPPLIHTEAVGEVVEQASAQRKQTPDPYRNEVGLYEIVRLSY